MIVLVCGGRFYSDEAFVFEVLDTIHEEYGITLLVQGEATGADSLAKKWALDRDVPEKGFKANWKKYWKAAGPIRNTEMLEESNPELVVAFPGDEGTFDMISKAKRAKVEVIKL